MEVVGLAAERRVRDLISVDRGCVMTNLWALYARIGLSGDVHEHISAGRRSSIREESNRAVEMR